MILESIGLSICAYSAFKIYETSKLDEIELKNKWKRFIAGVGCKNHLNQSYEILKVIKKKYGYDCIVSLPDGLSYKKLEDAKSMIESSLGCEIKLNLSENKNTAYMRCFYNFDVDDEFIIKLKWENIMHAANIHNYNHETFTIKHLEIKEYGYDLEINVPLGLSYEQLEKIFPIISRNFNNALIVAENKQFLDKTNIKLITKPIPDDYPYKVIKCEPQQLYLGITHYHEYVIADLYKTPHMIIAGTTGAGKSVFLSMIITNLIANTTDKQLNLFFAQVSNKDEDFHEFKYLKHTKYYADSVGKALNLYKYLYEQIKVRSKLFSKHHVKNIREYNKLVSEEEKLPVLICINDEFGALRPGSKQTDLNYQSKIDCIYYLEKIATEGRSTGIFLIVGVQRPDREHYPPFMKNLMTIVVGMRAENEASSKVILDDGRLANLPFREAIVRFGINEYRVKTPYIDTDVIKKLVKPYYEKNHKYISLKLNQDTSNSQSKEEISNQESFPNNTINLTDIKTIKKTKKKNSQSARVGG